jgi:hypothetical protein
MKQLKAVIVALSLLPGLVKEIVKIIDTIKEKNKEVKNEN